MVKLFVSFFAVLMLLVSLEAEAARFGGGRSFGRQSGNVTQRQATPAAPTQGANQSAATKPAVAGAAGAAAAPKRGFGGMLGGLAAGLGLAWLAHSLGLGEAFGSVLLIAVLAMLAFAAFRYFTRARGAAASGSGSYAFGSAGAGGPGSTSTRPFEHQPATAFEGAGPSDRPWSGAATGATGGALIGSALGGAQSWGVPDGFDSEGFLAAAKRNFITLQNAWDQADIKALRAMMTDGMVTEIQSQLAERGAHIGGAPNQTEVVALEAQLLGIEELPDAYMASVEFTGVIREDPAAGPSPFREVWNMTRPASGGGGWLVAGVQALQ
ncbi:MAG: TIM44-like domain-containing protein [Variovorax sp.]